ncbi:hypothetical protein IGI04_030889 [Brassica rapa subsp. trilocularis]|uniref:Uncharacterized protein n=1 Tax=Brassica rapa subsp. trilocularis TaxID=1813537 RepID=A0ABQ7LS16_BRACM|nr:hypothetical protein IGI04_030889 [Brassica rapa subsp. trilocularis]
MKEPPPLPPPPDPNPFANQPGRHMDFSASRALHRSSSLSPLLPDLPGVPLCPPASLFGNPAYAKATPPVAHTTTPFSFKENGSPSNTASLPEGIEKVTGQNTLDGTTNESVTWSSVGKIPDSKAKVTISPEGRPRVKIPQAVFERGAKLHSDYIVGIFYGKPPSYGKIWGVLNFLWGKDRRVSHDKRKQDKVKETHKPPTPQVVPTPPVSVKGKEAVMEEAVSTNFSEPISLDPQPSFSHLDLPRSEEILEEVQITLNQCRVGDGSTSTTTVSNSFAALCSEEAMAEDIEHSPLAMVIHNPKAHNSSVSPNRKRLKRQRASPSPHSSPGTGGTAVIQAWQGAIYLIWQERNRRFHDGQTFPPARIMKSLISLLRIKALALSATGRALGDKLLFLWSGE